MNISILFSLAMLFLFFPSQIEEENNTLILHIKSDMAFQPKGIFYTLNQLDESQKLQKHQQTEYAQIKQAIKKNDLLIISDPFISVALHLYKDSNDTLQKKQSHYYADEKINYDLNQKHEQLFLFLSVTSIQLSLLLLLWRCYIIYRRRKSAELATIEEAFKKKYTENLDYKNRLDASEKQLYMSQQNREILLNEKMFIEETLYQKEEEITRLVAEKKQMSTVVNQLKLLVQKNDMPIIEKEEYRLIKAYHLYKSLVICPQKSICHTSADWELLFIWTDITCKKFYTRLNQAYPTLKKRDLQICCLLKLGFSNEEMRMIFDIQQGTLYTDKNHTKHRLGISEGVKIEKWLSLY